MYTVTPLCIKQKERDYIEFRKISIAKVFHSAMDDLMEHDTEYQNHLKEKQSSP
ncbi:MAG: hypothetical protein WC525_04980 [Candidatus Thermoplasmatota archaeon]